MQGKTGWHPMSPHHSSNPESTAPIGVPLVNAPSKGDAERANRELDAFVPLESIAANKRRKKTRTIIIGVAAAALVIVGIAGFALWQTWQSALNAIPPKTATVERALFTNNVEGKGSLEPVSSVIASPEVDGIVERLSVSEGSTVTEGDELFTIKNDSLASAVTQAGSQLESARTALAQAQNTLSAAYESQNQVSQASSSMAASAQTSPSASGSAPAQTFVADTTSSNAEVANAELGVQSAQSALVAAQDSYDSAVAQADKRTVRASMSGVVLVCNLTQGMALSSLSTSGAVPLQIADTSKMIVKVPISEIDIAQLKVGKEAEISFDALSDTTCTATVTHIANSASSSAASQATGTGSTSNSVRYEVTLLIDSPDARLKSGMTAQAKITTEIIEDALVVSSFAIIEEDGETSVAKLDENNGVQRVKVTVVSSNDTQTVIEGSVKEGDRLVVQSSGTSALSSGSDIGLTAAG